MPRQADDEPAPRSSLPTREHPAAAAQSRPKTPPLNLSGHKGLADGGASAWTSSMPAANAMARACSGGSSSGKRQLLRQSTRWGVGGGLVQKLEDAGMKKVSPGGGMKGGAAGLAGTAITAFSNAAANKLREERELQTRLKAATLTYDAHFAMRGQKQAMAALADPETLKGDIKKVRRRLKTSGRWLILPEHPFVRFWDVLTLLSLMFTIFVTPYEIGFLSTETTSLGLEILNYVVLVVFSVGIVMQFFMPFRESYLVGGARVKDHKRIAIRYLRSWFVLDFVSTMPYELVANLIIYGSPRPTAALGVDAVQGGDGTVMLKASTTLRMLRLLRIVRLLKLGRVARASKIAGRVADQLERYVSISYSVRTLFSWTLLMLVLIHWFCCVWGLVGQEQGTQRTLELETLRLATFEGERRQRALKTAVIPGGGGAAGSGGGAAADSSDIDISTGISDIKKCQPGAGYCLSACELQLLSALRGWDLVYASSQESWMCRAVSEGKVPPDFQQIHGAAYSYLLQSSGLLTTPSTLAEYVTYFILSFLFLIISNVFVGVVAAAQSEADPQTKEFKSRMDHLNHFLSDMRVRALRALEAHTPSPPSRLVHHHLLPSLHMVSSPGTCGPTDAHARAFSLHA